MLDLSSLDLLAPTVKLALPPFSQFQARGHDSQWNTASFVPQTAFAPDIQQHHQPTSASSVGSSPRAGSSGGTSIGNQSYDSNTSYAPPVNHDHKPGEFQTPSPRSTLAPTSLSHPHAHPYQSAPNYPTMHQPQQYMDGHSQPPAPPPSMPQYSSYGQPQALQPAAHSYASAAYPQYSYGHTMPPMSAGHPVTSSMGGSMIPQSSLPVSTITSTAQTPAGGNPQYQQQFDTTGQIAPPGMKPRVTATLWEDEGTLCFQVEANGVCVARREDNHMINGTKLLNVAGMTRGRRDGILKSEKTRHVVKIGPMHLKGVW